MVSDVELPSEDENPATSSSSAVRLIAMVVFFTAVYFLASVLVPFLFALVLAIALAPLAGYLQRAGLGRTVSSLICMLLVAAFLLGTTALISYQAGSMLKKSDQYVDRLGDLSARAIRFAGGDRALESITSVEESEDESAMSNQPAPEDEGDAVVARVKRALRREGREIGRWTASGIGGLLGGLGQTIIFLAFLFYMLQGRHEWIDRLRRTAQGLGMRPRHREFVKVANELGSYLKMLAMVSLVYAVVISLIMWLIGVPQPLLWGILTALLEVIPFFGPIIAAALPTLAALGAGDGVWQPIAVVVVFLVLQTVEGYVVAPLLYGKSVDIEPVTVLLGVLFFGFLLGPAGLALAMPLMILLRGVLIITPDTPALDALADTDEAPGKAS